MTDHKHTNRLIDESSPYLLQHAHNPVDWYPWCDEAFEKAKAENKLVLVSIGYSSCHWCHVMERESFENENVAAFMNAHFVNIKVDREERPDVDQIYMSAVQLMTGSGGWPLNCFTLPDGRPVYGGTYFKSNDWLNILEKLSDLLRSEPEKLTEYAEKLTEGIKQSELIEKKSAAAELDPEVLETMVKKWERTFDYREGGPNRAPKFPLPNNYLFLLQYAHRNNDATLLEFINLTLKKMARGGIYDQVGGGFARYSVDGIWKVPHFEKMLYDNAQLVSLYAEAYKLTKDEEFAHVVSQTIEFLEREMTGPNGEFYSALDADSEGVEGKFYVWSKEELKDALGEAYEFAVEYYNVNQRGEWEGNYIPLRTKSDKEIAAQMGIELSDVREKVEMVNKRLLATRAARIRPGLDDKSLTSWNAMMVKGYVDAYFALGEDDYLDKAMRSANFMRTYQLRSNGGLNHSYKGGTSSINGYLEDYCFTVDAFFAMYEATFDPTWLNEAKMLIDYTIDHFFDDRSGMFFFTSDQDAELIARKTEIMDNVIPASNSEMAKVLFKVGTAMENEHYLKIADQMLHNVYDRMPSYASGFSNWGILALWRTEPFHEVAIVGTDAIDRGKEFNSHYVPNKIMMGSIEPSKLPLLQNRFVENETKIYVCFNKACQLPVTDVEEALEQLQ